MNLTKTALIICCLLFAVPGRLHANGTYTVKGVVITPDGKVVPEFSVVVRPVANKPELVSRKHFNHGEFTLDGLEPGKYQIDIVAPQFIRNRMNVDLKVGVHNPDYSIIVLHQYRNEARLTPGAAYQTSLRVLQQKIPDAAKEAYQRGVELHREGNLDAALLEYGKALRSYPQYLQALTDIGTIFLLYNRPESALSFLRRALDVDDSNPVINLNVAIAMTEQGDSGGAMKLLKKILQREPRMAIAQLFMARIYTREKKYEQAETYLRQALENDPALLDGWLLLVDLSMEQRKYDQVREGLIRVREALRNDTVAQFIDEQLSGLGG
jgi:tetratricopeptide (TPR) repeat protein